jgi:hypothetical protein
VICRLDITSQVEKIRLTSIGLSSESWQKPHADIRMPSDIGRGDIVVHFPRRMLRSSCQHRGDYLC